MPDLHLPSAEQADADRASHSPPPALHIAEPDRSPPSASCPSAPSRLAASVAGAEGHEADGGERSGSATRRRSMRCPICICLLRTRQMQIGHRIHRRLRCILPNPIARLRQLHVLQHRPLTLPDGTVLKDMKLTEASDRVRQYAAQAAVNAMPDLHLPSAEQAAENHLERKPFLAETEAGTIHGVDDLLIPQRGFERNDRVLAWSAKDGVTVYAVGGDVAKFGCAAVKDPPSGAAWTETSLRNQ